MPTTISGSTGVSQVQDGVITAADLDGAQTGSAPIYGCRAWVNFDGTKDSTGATSTANTNRLILGSGNVASVLRNAAGNYTINFTTAMPDANYGVTLGSGLGSQTARYVVIAGSPTSSGVTVATASSTPTFNDSNYVTVSIFR